MHKVISSLKKKIWKLPDRRYFLILFISSALVYSLGVLRVQSILWGDSLYYYAYTRSITIDHNIDFSNEAYLPSVGFPNEPEISQQTFRITNKFSPGTSLFWIPGFVVGESFLFFIELFTGFNSASVPGYSIVTQFFVGMSSIAFSVSGLWFMYKTLRFFFRRLTSLLSVAIVFLTTQVFYYTAVDPVNSHSVSFLLSAIFLYLFAKCMNKKISWKHVLPLGVIAGMLALVRNQDIVVVIPAAAYLIFIRKDILMNRLNWSVLFGGSVLTVLSIQLFTTLELFGVVASPYLLRGERLNWLQPDFVRVLLSSQNGLFYFAPLLLIATGALIWIVAQTVASSKQPSEVIEVPGSTRKFIPLIVVSLCAFLLQTYVIASWGPEIIGGPYGSRMFMSIIPYLTLGIGITIAAAKRRLNTLQFSILYCISLLIFTGNAVVQTLVMLQRF